MYDIPMPMNQDRQLPTLHGLRQEDLPEIMTMEVGNTRYLVVKVEMISKRSGKALDLGDKNDVGKMEADFQIHSIKCLGKEPVDAKSLESKEFQAVVAKVKSGQM